MMPWLRGYPSGGLVTYVARPASRRRRSAADSRLAAAGYPLFLAFQFPPGTALVQAHACMDACYLLHGPCGSGRDGAAVQVQVQARQARTARPTATRFFFMP